MAVYREQESPASVPRSLVAVPGSIHAVLRPMLVCHCRDRVNHGRLKGTRCRSGSRSRKVGALSLEERAHEVVVAPATRRCEREEQSSEAEGGSLRTRPSFVAASGLSQRGALALVRCLSLARARRRKSELLNKLRPDGLQLGRSRSSQSELNDCMTR